MKYERETRVYVRGIVGMAMGDKIRVAVLDEGTGAYVNVWVSNSALKPIPVRLTVTRDVFGALKAMFGIK